MSWVNKYMILRNVKHDFLSLLINLFAGTISPISIFNYDVPSNLTAEIQKKGNHSNLVFALPPKAASSKLPFVTASIRRRRQLFIGLFFKYVKPSLTQ